MKTKIAHLFVFVLVVVSLLRVKLIKAIYTQTFISQFSATIWQPPKIS